MNRVKTLVYCALLSIILSVALFSQQSGGDYVANGQTVLPTSSFVGISISFILCFIPLLFYALSLRKAYRSLPKEGKAIPGWLFWLVSIPFFGAPFLFVIAIIESAFFRKEIKARGLSGDGGFGVSIALAVSGLLVLMALLFSILPKNASGSVSEGLSSLVIVPIALWVAHWIIVVKAGKQFVERMGAQVVSNTESVSRAVPAAKSAMEIYEDYCAEKYSKEATCVFCEKRPEQTVKINVGYERRNGKQTTFYFHSPVCKSCASKYRFYQALSLAIFLGSAVLVCLLFIANADAPDLDLGGKISVGVLLGLLGMLPYTIVWRIINSRYYGAKVNKWRETWKISPFQ